MSKTNIQADDLSEFHRSIGGDFSDSGKDGCVLTAEARDLFERDGFLTGIRLLSLPQIELLRDDLSLLMDDKFASDERFYEFNFNESADPSGRLFHALGAWRLSQAFHDLIFMPSLVNLAEALLGGPVRLWHDQLFVKPARNGGKVVWHQDYSYWVRTRPIAHLTCWIGLDDSTVENGCVHYIPGSQRWPLLPRQPIADDMDKVLGLLNNEQKAAFKPIPAELSAGFASFHHPMTLHGSYSNTSAAPRRAAVVNFIRDGVVSDSDQELLAGVPPIPKGLALNGRFFPLLSGSN